MIRPLPLLFSLLGAAALGLLLALAAIDGPARSARAQSASTPTAQVAAAAARGSNGEPWLFVYEVATERLAAYKSGNDGLELRGLRRVTWDLRLEDLQLRAARGKPLLVPLVRKLVEQQGAAAAQEPDAPKGPVSLVTAQGAAGEPFVFLHDLSSQRVASYRVVNLGIELMGVRQITWDLKLEELNPGLGRPPKVADVKALAP